MRKEYAMVRTIKNVLYSTPFTWENVFLETNILQVPWYYAHKHRILQQNILRRTHTCASHQLPLSLKVVLLMVIAGCVLIIIISKANHPYPYIQYNSR